MRAPGGGDCTPTVLAPVAVYCHQGNGIGADDSKGNAPYALKIKNNAGDNRLAIVQPISDGGCSTLFENHGQDCRYKGPLKVAQPVTATYGMGGNNTPFAVSVIETSENIVVKKYIVRRLTPTECARLQGFPDKWGHPDKKEDFTEEEYKFWLNVRNTYAKINGKPEKEYTKAQMLTWYSKLHTDSAEYKMWGNGIALLNALYVMQGIVSKGD